MAAERRKPSLQVWRSLREYGGDAAIEGSRKREFLPGATAAFEPPAEDAGRRRFLGLVGASLALAGASACSRPEQGTVVPYTRKSEEVVPGVADYYASSFAEGHRVHSVLVKAREGRPIHVDGNDEHPAVRGASSARVQAQVLGLYDPDRIRTPLMEGKPAGWEPAMEHLLKALREAKEGGRPVLLLTGAVTSPSRAAVIDHLRSVLPSLEHVAWEPLSDAPGRAAAEALFGEFRRPEHRFDRARVILSLDGDFLGRDGDGTAAILRFAEGRRVRKRGDSMSRLVVAEGALSLTGSNADVRLAVRPSHLPALGFALARLLNEKHAVPLPEGFPASALAAFDPAAVAARCGLASSRLESVAADLAGARGAALAVCGPHLPPEAHAAAHLLNAMAASADTVEWSAAIAAPILASTAEMAAVLAGVREKKYPAVVLWGVNPVHGTPGGEAWAAALKACPLSAAIASLPDESAAACSVVLPENHWLESWGDHRETSDLLLLQQPLIEPLFDTRQGEAVLLELASSLGGSASRDVRTFIRERWRREVYPADAPVDFDGSWNAALHDGLLRVAGAPQPAPVLRPGALARAAGEAARPQGEGGFDLVLGADAKVYDGRYANNGWLQEMPDPLTTQTWGNVLCLSVKDAASLGVGEGDLVTVKAGGASVTAPAFPVPGAAEGTAFLALGYGRTAGSVAAGVGVNAFALAGSDSSPFLRRGVALSAAGGSVRLAVTQTHHTMEGRDIVRSAPLQAYTDEGLHAGHGGGEHASLYKPRTFGPHKWGMVIDANACVGCGGCVVACQSENNVPVVGPEQVMRGREMHWIRVDRYFDGPPEAPKVLHQPMLCQQCDDAPCENVCPVNATTHSAEGLNQQTYNRCVGTRYCANNCPYKVRRFNFLDFTRKIPAPQDLAFNPEVTVRPRGVMEKCTFCLQRIQNAKQVAANEGRPVRDGDVVPACAAACPAKAIVFGDLLDESSAVAALSKNDRGFKVLADLGVKPAVTYLAKLRNDAGEGAHEA